MVLYHGEYIMYLHTLKNVYSAFADEMGMGIISKFDCRIVWFSL